MRTATIISFTIAFIFCTCNNQESKSEEIKYARDTSKIKVNGVVLSDNVNVVVLKVWGSHKERGFAYGYLLGNKIKQVYDAYIGKAMRSKIAFAKEIVLSGKYLKIDEKYVTECKAIIDGMKSAGYVMGNFDYLDLILANSFLDLQSITKTAGLSNGCSSLMAWGEATEETSLKGKSIITRNLDWTAAKSLINNNLILIHVPSELDEQAWLSIGYVGHVGALSGTNQSGLSIFQHMMYDNFSNKEIGKYEPVWFTIRKALEQNDFDKSGQNDVNDLRAVINENKHGYADGYILAALSSANEDSLIALVAELGPEKPFVSYRTNKYNDKIKGDMLYAANYPICRKDRQRYGTRYNAVEEELNAVKKIDEEFSWKIMTSASCLEKINLQLMQIIPERGILKLSVWKDGKGAYKHKPVIYNLTELFKPVVKEN